MYNDNKMCVSNTNNNNITHVSLLFYLLCFKLLIDWNAKFINCQIF